MEAHVCVPPSVPRVAMDTDNATVSSSGSNPPSVSRPQPQHDGRRSPVNGELDECEGGEVGRCDTGGEDELCV